VKRAGIVAALLLAAPLGCDEPAARGSSLLGAAARAADAGAGAEPDARDASREASWAVESAARGCRAAERLVPATFSARSLLRAADSTTLGADTNHSELVGCRDLSSGPDRWYALDLSGFAAAVELHAVVNAGFASLLELRRGACGDSESLDCDRAQGVAATSSSIAARLEPDVYWLVVDGEGSTSRGEFELQVELDPAPDTCTGTSAAGSCGAPLPLEPLARQTLLLDEACLPLADDGDANAWYELDLSGESHAVLVHAAAWTLSEAASQHFALYDAADAACETELAYSSFSRGLGRSNAELSALLGPGRYQLQLSFSGAAAPRAGLDQEIERDACAAGPIANQCADAIAIDPTLPRQVLEGNTACNSNRFQSRCAELEAPEQFYRLDLRGMPGPVRARVTTLVEGLGFGPTLALLTADSEGTCPEAVYCDESYDNAEGPPHLELTLDPQLHYLVIDGAEPSAGGPYRLLVELEPAERRACVDARIDACVSANGQADCCGDWSPACDAAAALCGLARATQQCVCAMAPGCCAAERDAESCRAAQRACNYLCADYAASEDTCLAPPP
jgi:hypothetical protein